MSWFENHFNWVLWVLFFHVIDTVLRKLRITSLLQRNFQLLIQIFLAEMTKTSELKAIWKRLLLVLLEVCSMFSSCVPFCRKSWKLRAKKEVEYHSRLVHIPYFSHYYSGFPTFRAVLTLLQYVQTLKKNVVGESEVKYSPYSSSEYHCEMPLVPFTANNLISGRSLVWFHCQSSSKKTIFKIEAIHFTSNMLDNALNNQHVEGTQRNEFGKRYLVCEGEDITKGEDIPSFYPGRTSWDRSQILVCRNFLLRPCFGKMLPCCL